MTVSKSDIKNGWVDPDDAPELTDTWFDNANLMLGETVIKRGGRPRGSHKEQVTLRLDTTVLKHFRDKGPGWQTRINDALRELIGKSAG